MSIDVGDMVEQIDGCCERTRGTIGWRGRVESLFVVLEADCKFCGAPVYGMSVGVNIEQPGAAPIKWFRPIPPSADAKRERARELSRRTLDWLGTNGSSVWERMHMLEGRCARRLDETRTHPADLDIEYAQSVHQEPK